MPCLQNGRLGDSQIQQIVSAGCVFNCRIKMLQEESRALPAKVAVPFLEVSQGCRTGLLAGLGLTVICPRHSLGSADQATVETLGDLIRSVT